MYIFSFEVNTLASQYRLDEPLLTSIVVHLATLFWVQQEVPFEGFKSQPQSHWFLYRPRLLLDRRVTQYMAGDETVWTKATSPSAIHDANSETVKDGQGYC